MGEGEADIAAITMSSSSPAPDLAEQMNKLQKLTVSIRDFSFKSNNIMCMVEKENCVWEIHTKTFTKEHNMGLKYAA